MIFLLNYLITLQAGVSFLLLFRDELLPCETVRVTPPTLPALIGIERWSRWASTPRRSSDLAPLSIPPVDFVGCTLTDPALPPCPLLRPDALGELSSAFIAEDE